jgi:hypothetical protein
MVALLVTDYGQDAFDVRLLDRQEILPCVVPLW